MAPFAPTITLKKPKAIGGFESEESEKKDRIGFYEDEKPRQKTESYGEWVGYLSFQSDNRKSEFSFNHKAESSQQEATFRYTKETHYQPKSETPRIEIKSAATAAVGEAVSGIASAAENTTKIAMKATKSFGEAFLDLFEEIAGKKMPLLDKLFKKDGQATPKTEQKPQADNPKAQEAQKAKEVAQFRAAKMREIQEDVAAVEQKKIQELTKDALRILGAGLEEVADIVDAKSDVKKTQSFIAKLGSSIANIGKISLVGKNSITLAKQKTSWAQEANKKAQMAASAKDGQQAVNLHGIAEGSTGGASSNMSSTGGGAG